LQKKLTKILVFAKVFAKFFFRESFRENFCFRESFREHFQFREIFRANFPLGIQIRIQEPPVSRFETLVENFCKNGVFTQKSSWEQKYIAKTFAKTKMFAKTFTKAFSENEKWGIRFNPNSDTAPLKIM
jgi:hypothetical protein